MFFFTVITPILYIFKRQNTKNEWIRFFLFPKQRVIPDWYSISIFKRFFHPLFSGMLLKSRAHFVLNAKCNNIYYSTSRYDLMYNSINFQHSFTHFHFIFSQTKSLACHLFYFAFWSLSIQPHFFSPSPNLYRSIF